MDHEQLQVLNQEAELLFEKQPRVDWAEYRAFCDQTCWTPTLFATPGRATCLYDFVGLSQQIDTVIDTLLAGKLGDFLRGELGHDYKIWYAQIRHSAPWSDALRMHSDMAGEIGVNILLSDTGRDAATTIVVPRSQSWPRLVNIVPVVPPVLLHWASCRAEGNAGDAFIFNGTTWHGRRRSRGASTKSIILNFMPANLRPTNRTAVRSVWEKFGNSLKRAMAHT